MLWALPGFLSLLPVILLNSVQLSMPAKEDDCSGCTIYSIHPVDYPLILPDLETLPPFDLRLVRDEENKRLILRFSNSIWNSGRGSLELRGKVDRTLNRIAVTQYYQNAWGREEAHRVGEFIFHPAHQHWHLDGFSIYEIWSLLSDGSPDSLLATSGKVSYCLLDSAVHPIHPAGDPASPRRFYSCEPQIQGISPGWLDSYRFDLPGQWLDISDLPDGEYVLVSRTDPFDIVREADEHNNDALTYFQLAGQRILVGDVFSGDERSRNVH